MFPFSPASTPAVRSHVDSQLAYFNDLSQAIASSFRNVCEANLTFGQSMVEETMSAAQRMLHDGRSGDVFGTVAACAQPASDKLRAWQQHLSKLAADTQVELARVTQQHAPEHARTANALADDVSRVATEETERSMQQQAEVLKKFRDPFMHMDGQQRGKDGDHKQPAAQDSRATPGAPVAAAAGKQFDGLADNGAFHGNVQGPVAQAAGQLAQQGSKHQRKPS